MILKTIFYISITQRPTFTKAQNGCESRSNNGIKQEKKKPFHWINQLLITHHNRSERWGPEGDSCWLLGWARKKMSSNHRWCGWRVYLFGKGKKCWLLVYFNFSLFLSPPSTSLYRGPKIFALHSSINSRKYFWISALCQILCTLIGTVTPRKKSVVHCIDCEGTKQSQCQRTWMEQDI